MHISTDEIYGDIKKGRFTENSLLSPSSPYAASKAAADLLIKSYIRTYGFPVIIVRPCNNYGPWQYPEKLIPVIIYSALKNKKVPIYAKGLNTREWLYVLDCVEAICLVLEKAKPGEIYNIGSGCEERNIDVAKKILDILGKPHSLIKFVTDRPGHDSRYSLDFSKIKKLGWRPKISFTCGIKKTVAWNVANYRWLKDKLTKP
jgi:dTDP-glucose 4,6-dehydratase